MKPLNKLLHFFSGGRISGIYKLHNKAQKVQEETLKFLIKNGTKTIWGQDHNYTKNMSFGLFLDQTPLSYYEDLYPYIERTLNGQSDILWPGRTYFFAKSSGTTNDRSKYIPLTRDSLDRCHFRGGKDMALFYLYQYPRTKLLFGKTVGVGGSFDTNHSYAKDIVVGDLSAILMRELPFWVRHRRAPRLETATINTWEQKLEELAKESLSEDIRAIAGVPSWSQLFIKKVIEISGKKSIYDIWPNFEIFFHGGVSLDPYRSSFRGILGENFHYEELYNASEGFFAIQDQPRRAKELLLMLDYHIFYEFIPFSEIQNQKPQTLMIHQVEIGKPYALVITTSGGLWRYVIGDVVEFSSLNPYRIKIVGRTTSSINIFGEELMVGNTDQALKDVCQDFGVTLEEYTVAPCILGGATSGLHEWAIEFVNAPKDLEKFTIALDNKLRQINSDYDAKRKGDMLLKNLKIHAVKAGTFYKFMESRNRLGGQTKVPRLSEKRIYLEKILELI